MLDKNMYMSRGGVFCVVISLILIEMNVNKQHKISVTLLSFI